jgi:GAF domain-containing protein
MLPGYRIIDLIHEGSKTLVYRAKNLLLQIATIRNKIIKLDIIHQHIDPQSILNSPDTKEIKKADLEHCLQQWIETGAIEPKNSIQSKILSRFSQAEEYDHRTIELARKNGQINEEALSQELAVECNLQGDRKENASVSLKEACDNYSRWGAIAFVQDLTERYPQLLFLIMRSKLDPSLSWHSLNSSCGDEKLTPSLVNSIETLVRAIGADKGYLFLPSLEKLNTSKEIISQSANTMVVTSTTNLNDVEFPLRTIERVERTLKSIVIDCPSQLRQYSKDAYINKYQPKSIICFPIGDREKFLGILYLEHNRTSRVFSKLDLPLLNLCGVQIALSLENQILHQYSERLLEKQKRQLT